MVASSSFAETVRITRTYALGTVAARCLDTYWREVNAVLALMGKPEALFGDILAKYEDECSVDQAAHEIADPAWGYETYLAMLSDARRAAFSEAR